MAPCSGEAMHSLEVSGSAGGVREAGAARCPAGVLHVPSGRSAAAVAARSGSRKGAEMGRKDAPVFGPQLFLTPSGPVISSLNRPRQTARGAARGPAAGAGGPADR